jgi:ribosomal protein L20A (L18A)
MSGIMKFIVEGSIPKQGRSFKIEIEAKTEKHARDLAIVKLGSISALRKSEISILKVENKK